MLSHTFNLTAVVPDETGKLVKAPRATQVAIHANSADADQLAVQIMDRLFLMNDLAELVNSGKRLSKAAAVFYAPDNNASSAVEETPAVRAASTSPTDVDAIRAVFTMHGKVRIFNNKLVSGRSVKAYGTDRETQLVADLNRVIELRKMDACIIFNTPSNNQSWGALPSIIVRIKE